MAEGERVAAGAAPGDDDVLLDVVRLAMDASVTAADQLDGVSTAQLRALRVVRALPGANLVRLADRLAVGMSTTSRLVDRLVRAGLVERRPSPHTRREVTVTLSDRGADLLDRYDALRLQEVHRTLAPLEGAARRQLLAALRPWTEAAGRAHPPRRAGSTP